MEEHKLVAVHEHYGVPCAKQHVEAVDACSKHPAFEANNCPACGTSVKLGR